MSSETAWPIKAKFYVKHLIVLWNEGINVYINNLGHMTKMAAMPIYGKDSSKIFSGTGGQISKKLCMKHLRLKYYNVYLRNKETQQTLCFTKIMLCNAIPWY